MWSGFAGPEWEEFRSGLALYAIPVLRGWIRSGRIVRECASIDCGCAGLTDRTAWEQRAADRSYLKRGVYGVRDGRGEMARSRGRQHRAELSRGHGDLDPGQG